MLQQDLDELRIRHIEQDIQNQDLAIRRLFGLVFVNIGLLGLLSLILLGLIFGMSSAQAAEPAWHLQLHGFSKHQGDREWNERNPGLGIRYQHNPEWGFQGGFYRNSRNVRTEYLLAQWTPVGTETLRFGIFGGYASGYTTPWPGIAGFMATWQATNRISVGVRWIPRINQNIPGVLGFEAGVKF